MRIADNDNERVRGIIFTVVFLANCVSRDAPLVRDTIFFAGEKFVSRQITVKY